MLFPNYRKCSWSDLVLRCPLCPASLHSLWRARVHLRKKHGEEEEERIEAVIKR